MPRREKTYKHVEENETMAIYILSFTGYGVLLTKSYLPTVDWGD